MTKLLFLICAMATVSGYSQIGMGTSDPKANLDIRAANIATPTNSDGLLIPRINAFPLVNPTTDQNSMLVYLNTATGSGSPFGINSTGYYYWDFAALKWIGVITSQSLSWSLSGNSSTVDGTNFIGTTDNIPLNFKINSQKAGRINTIQTFFGYQAGNSNPGSNNTGIGDQAFFSNTTGNSNTAIGSQSMYKNLTGNENTALGTKALYENEHATGSTGIGYEALFLNANGAGNVAVGYKALRTTTLDSNTGIGYQALTGTTTGDSNTAVGRDAIMTNTTGSSNTALGRDALRLNTVGYDNTAVGRNALYSNVGGALNTATGIGTLYSNTSGSNNTAIGLNALRANTTGDTNTAVGKEALFNNTEGGYNTALGFATLYINTTGNANTAVGDTAARNITSGSRNTAIGTQALRDNTTGNQNSAVGRESMRNTTTGSDNASIGTNALLSNITGYNNTAVGSYADVSTSALTNATALGSGAVVNSSNKVRIGNTSVTVIEGQVAMSVASDERFKENIKTIPLGLDFINRLHPVEYIKKNNSGKTKEWGLIAQELQKTLQQIEYKNAGIITSDNSKNGFLAVRYTDLFAPMIKSIQELSESKNEIADLKQMVKNQEKIINELLIRIDKLEKK